MLVEHRGMRKHEIFTQNEINNIIYICLKFIWGKIIVDLEQPSNKMIHEIILSVHEEPTLDNLILEIISAVIDRYGHILYGVQIDRLKENMKDLIFYAVLNKKNCMHDSFIQTLQKNHLKNWLR